MGRKRQHNTHLPRRMVMRRGAFYYLANADGVQTWKPLGRDYSEVLRQWAQFEGRSNKPVLTVADAIAHYLDDRAKKLSGKTLADYRRQAITLGAVFDYVPLGWTLVG